MPEALHISNGDATDVPGTGLARRVIYWRDILHEGPVPEVAPAELRRIRAGYLTGDHSAGRARIMRQFTERDQALEANRDGEYVLWFEADLYDQLQIAEILARLADLGVPAERITLICIGEHAGIVRFGGLGELTAGQLRELPHTNACARLTPAALELATRAWAAFRAPSPEGLGAIAASRLGELRFLGEAFDRLSREYPAMRDGLSLTERRVLAAVADGAPDAGTAFVRAGRGRRGRTWETPRASAGWTGWRRAAPAAPPRPARPPRGADDGRAPDRHRGAGLAGQADQIALNGIDRWIGGVHLQGHHVPWRWDDGTETIVHLPDKTRSPRLARAPTFTGLRTVHPSAEPRRTPSCRPGAIGDCKPVKVGGHRTRYACTRCARLRWPWLVTGEAFEWFRFPPECDAVAEPGLLGELAAELVRGQARGSADDGMLHRPQGGGGSGRYPDLGVDVLDVVVGCLG